jgi:hypothetical protein
MNTPLSTPPEELNNKLLSTDDAWMPIEELQEAHVKAMRELTSAVWNGDEVAMKEAFDTIQYIELRQRVAHANVRLYQLQKTQNRLG